MALETEGLCHSYWLDQPVAPSSNEPFWIRFGLAKKQVDPASMVQAELQPSPSAPLPSSHCSPAVRTPSPQVEAQGTPAEGQV